MSSGKSTLIRRFKNAEKDDELQPTTALDYSFARTVDKGKTGTKDVAHFWELGGGTSLPDLLDVPLNENNLKSTVLVIVADLSKPNEVMACVQFWLRKLEKRMQALEQICKKEPKLAKLFDMLRERSIKRFGEGGEKHKDMQGPLSHMFKVHAVSVVIVANKYDEFAQKAPELKRVMSRTLRFVAHINGASLVYTSQNEKQLISNFRQVVSQYLFKGQQVRRDLKVVDHLKPLMVPAGSDLILDIGTPPMESVDDNKPSDPLQYWLQYFERCFGPIQSLVADEGPAFILDPKGQYKEASVDKALTCKEEDLNMYREMQEKEREEQANETKPLPARKLNKAPSIKSKPKASAASQE
uniref:Cytoplasmic dynein 2 light intermediate chain 1 n=1 Tax=Hanusia phi TaxID=3032 RepID=A0A7S0HWD4_9CRYP